MARVKAGTIAGEGKERNKTGGETCGEPDAETGVGQWPVPTVDLDPNTLSFLCD